ncbi:hypothetical protein FQA47_018269 [Oryzias melastigma]|uniref:Uncharacterized protein n=1 Tax=Oryzias melastigma TaxID=30732 RepID=A0A834FS03_ORYME|nr:hypothetical protein FQA47_018269 [Oryzias melastigma]
MNRLARRPQLPPLPHPDPLLLPPSPFLQKPLRFSQKETKSKYSYFLERPNCVFFPSPPPLAPQPLAVAANVRGHQIPLRASTYGGRRFQDLETKESGTNVSERSFK